MARAVIQFEGGRGGHFGGKPNPNCKLTSCQGGRRPRLDLPRLDALVLCREQHLLRSGVVQTHVRRLNRSGRHCRIPSEAALHGGRAFLRGLSRCGLANPGLLRSPAC
jgi:hypothetical protein